jgi:hypothetical protein
MKNLFRKRCDSRVADPRNPEHVMEIRNPDRNMRARAIHGVGANFKVYVDRLQEVDEDGFEIWINVAGPSHVDSLEAAIVVAKDEMKNQKWTITANPFDGTM